MDKEKRKQEIQQIISGKQTDEAISILIKTIVDLEYSMQQILSNGGKRNEK